MVEIDLCATAVTENQLHSNITWYQGIVILYIVSKSYFPLLFLQS